MGRHGVDDLADRLLEIVRHPGHVGLALGHGPDFGFLLLGLKPLASDGVALEDLDGRGHPADLVGPADARHRGVESAVRDIGHGERHLLQRPRDAPGDERGDHQNERQDHGQDHQRALRRGPFLRQEIVDVDAGADHPAPGREALDIAQLGLRLLGADLGPVIVDIALAAGPHLVQHLGEEALAGFVLEVRQHLANELLRDRVHQQAAFQIRHEEIVVLAVAQGRDARERALLCIGHVRAALLRGVMFFLEDAERDLGDVAKFELLLLHQVFPELARIEVGDHQQTDEAEADQGVDLVANGHDGAERSDGHNSHPGSLMGLFTPMLASALSRCGDSHSDVDARPRDSMKV